MCLHPDMQGHETLQCNCNFVVNNLQISNCKLLTTKLQMANPCVSCLSSSSVLGALQLSILKEQFYEMEINHDRVIVGNQLLI